MNIFSLLVVIILIWFSVRAYLASTKLYKDWHYWRNSYDPDRGETYRTQFVIARVLCIILLGVATFVLSTIVYG